MMQYDMTFSNVNKKEEEVFEDSIRLSENMSYLFRMFLVSMTMIVLVLALSA